MPLRVIPIGGLGEIGLNAMLFDDGETAILVDAGLMFPDDTMLGVDYVVPDYAALEDVASRLAGVLLTHGHEDHIGAVPFVLREFDVPVFATRLTLGLLRHRLNEHGMEGSVTLREVGREERFSVGSFEVEAFPVCHSIPDAVGFIIRTAEGVFVHTGDFKVDDRSPDGVPTGIERLRRLADEEGVVALFSDSTNVEKEGRSLSESFVGEALSGILEKAPGRVIVAMFSSNIHRVRQVIEAAESHGRIVALSGRSMVRYVNTALDLKAMALPRADIIFPIDDVDDYPPDRVVVLTTGSQGEPMSALTLMALRGHKHVKIRKGDTVVLSSKFIPGNERAISNLINHLFLAGADVLYEKISEIHVSGHASQGELSEMIEAVSPSVFVPVHGEPRHLIRHAKLAEEVGVPRVEVILNGDVLVFDGGTVRRDPPVQVGRIFVDGKGMGDVESIVLKDRMHMSQVGLVVSVMAVSTATGEILDGPEVVTRGVATDMADDDILEGARAAVMAAWSEASVEARKDPSELPAEIRRALRRYFNRKLQRKPMIVPIILEM